MKTLNGITPLPNGPLPPLPEPIPPFPIPTPFPPTPTPNILPEIPIQPPPLLRFLRCGCYLVNFTPTLSVLRTYDGTIRIECDTLFNKTASGDLYSRPLLQFPFSPRPILRLAPPPRPDRGIPIFARDRYKYYLRITKFLESVTSANKFTLGFEMHEYTKSSLGWSTVGTWSNTGGYEAVMEWGRAPNNFPLGSQYLTGDVKDASGKIVGKLTMGWVTDYLRKATIEIDRVADSEAPLDNGDDIDWQSIGNSIGWDIVVQQSSNSIAEPNGESWSNAELHAALLDNRDMANLDVEWRYHLLAVRRINGTPRGIMYDSGGTDSNNIPREGCAVATHWTIPNENEWGTVQNQRFGAASAPYFRTAVHEIGHAMGLSHNFSDNGIMNVTNVIADDSLTPGSDSFPDNIQWSFNRADVKRLKHLPDIFVRPGTLPFIGTPAGYAATPISPDDISFEHQNLKLSIQSIVEAYPLGAPIRVNLELKNIGKVAQFIPNTLSMKKGHIKGFVVDAHGNKRTFMPIILCYDDSQLIEIGANQSIDYSLTLLRGIQGALFPTAGFYKLIVEVHWEQKGVEHHVNGETVVIVTPAINIKHSIVANKLLSTPDTLLVLALGGDHLKEGIEVIQQALEIPELRPHYEYIEAKRYFHDFRERKKNIKKCATLINKDTVLTNSECIHLAELVKMEKKRTKAGERIISMLNDYNDNKFINSDVKNRISNLE